MKKAMLNNISWSNYIIAISVLLLIWYLILGFRFYLPDIKEILFGEKNLNSLVYKNHNKPQSAADLQNGSDAQNSLFSSYGESFDTLRDAEELSKRIQNAIEESVQRNLSGEEFQNYIRLLLQEYPFVKISALREKINTLMMSFCEQYPQLALSTAQIDALWEETL